MGDMAEELRHQAELAEKDEQLADVRKALRTSQRTAARAIQKTEDLREATERGAYDGAISFGPWPNVPRPVKDGRSKHEEVALWHLTDFQGSKKTTSYNSEIMRERVMLFCEKARKITQIQRADHPVKHCVIMFGGDMVEGLFNYSTQPFEIDATIFEQYVIVGRLLVEIVTFALSVYDTVEVVAEWGNHGRIGSKRSAVPRSDNFDRMVYELARQLLSKEPRLVWADCPEDIQHVEIGNYRALLIHGDEVGRNGFAAPTQIVQHANKWRSGSHKSGSWRSGVPSWEFRDIYIGHYHTHNEWAMANGEGSVYQTGSTESDNRYAGVHMASSAIPSQRLHFVDPKKGRVTSAYKIWLDE